MVKPFLNEKLIQHIFYETKNLFSTTLLGTTIFGCNDEEIKSPVSALNLKLLLKRSHQKNVNIYLIGAYTYSYEINGNKFDDEYRQFVITDGKYIHGENQFETASFKNPSYFLYVNTVNPINENLASTDFPITVYGKSCYYTLRRPGNSNIIKS